MQDRRKSARTRVFKNAKLFIGTSSVVDCLVGNLTNTGARVQIANTIDLPEELGITFDGGYSVRSCRPIWRTANEAGVEFL
jgi:hypothetical protein